MLICPLDWGLGHAARMIILIRLLQLAGYELILAADKAPLQLLRNEFPDLEWHRFPATEISYSLHIPLMLKMAFSLPRIVWGVYKEHRYLHRLVAKVNPDIIISDNRFGAWQSGVYSVYLTHQLMIKMPRLLRFVEPVLHRIHRWVINKYDRCWVPDWAGAQNLSGDLSHRYPLPAHAVFVGHLSRFSRKHETTMKKRYAILAVVSGPEPQRSAFEAILISELKKIPSQTVLIQGKPKETQHEKREANILIINHLETSEFKAMVEKSDLVVCRAGYSSVMDLVSLRQKAVLVPTPGQSEQEYLARYLQEQALFYSVSQKEFCIEKAIVASQKYRAPAFPDSDLTAVLAQLQVLAANKLKKL